MKQFDCQDMPDKIRRMYFDCEEGSNDCWLEWTVSTEPEEYSDEHAKVSKWLISKKAKEGEVVLIKHWW